MSADTTGQCFSFCSGFGGLSAVCRDGRCLRAGLARCPGDCDSDVRVDVDELVVGVGITLGVHAQAACKSYDRDANGATGIDELVTAVVAALGGCAAPLQPFPGDRGVYDGMITSMGEIDGEHEVVADVSEYTDDLYIDIELAPNIGISVSGPLNENPLALRLTSVLPEEGSQAVGVGRFLSGYDPPFGPEPYVPSFWTATRQ